MPYRSTSSVAGLARSASNRIRAALASSPPRALQQKRREGNTRACVENMSDRPVGDGIKAR